MQGARLKELRPAYGFDEVAIVPGEVTVNPDQTNVAFELRNVTLGIPVLASAMDGVVDPNFAVALGRLGGLAVLNLEGVQTRYQDPASVLAEIADTPAGEVTGLLQRVYSEPIKEALLGERVRQIKAGGALCAASLTPQTTKRFAPLAAEAGADVIVVQSTVTTARHISKSYRGLIFSELCQQVPVPVVVGNTVTYGATLELMRTGIAGVLVGVGPGAACTTREVTGVGVPQITATLDCSAARDQYFRETRRYVPIITDGGIRTGGDICKAFAAGADAVMIGSPFAATREAPGHGYHWGMATPHAALPRGIRINVGVRYSLEQLLFGPTSVNDGTQNLMGALRVCMGMVGALTVKDLHHRAELVVAPSIKTEGKLFQLGGQL